jgi:drug/metabolite transporter (DMT)-like permease
VLIKIGLADIPALTFAGLRYFIAFLCLLPFAFRRPVRGQVRKLSASEWLHLGILGLLFYAVTQGAQFLSLDYLPAASANLILSFTSILVALLGIPLLGEMPSPGQWTGVGVALLGVLVYFYPVDLPVDQRTGLGVAAVGLLANALSSILGRRANRSGNVGPLAITVVSMGIGSGILLTLGIVAQGMPHLTPANWALVAWLAIINSAAAFTLWNHTLRTLSAVESSIINNTMLFQIPLMAWLFLGETLNGQQIFGILLAMAGTLVVQLRRPPGPTGPES